ADEHQPQMEEKQDNQQVQRSGSRVKQRPNQPQQQQQQQQQQQPQEQGPPQVWQQPPPSGGVVYSPNTQNGQVIGRASRIKDRPHAETGDSSLKIKIELDLEAEVGTCSHLCA